MDVNELRPYDDRCKTNYTNKMIMDDYFLRMMVKPSRIGRITFSTL